MSMAPFLVVWFAALPDGGVTAGLEERSAKLGQAVRTTTGTTDAGTLQWDGRSAVKVPQGAALRLALAAAPTRLSATDGSVCEVASEAPAVLRLTGKKPGAATVVLWYGAAVKALQVDVVAAEVKAAPDAGVPLFTWDGEAGLTVPRDQTFDVQGPGGLERVAPGSHRRCVMTSIGNDQLRFRCVEAGPVSVFLWYANNRRRTLELDVK